MSDRPVKPLKPPVKRVIQPFSEFIRMESAGGILLLASAIAAMVWANSPWADSYDEFWRTTASVEIGRWSLEHSLREWINEGLMTIFLLLVGLEIKREILIGELSSPRRVLLPLMAALGGMLIPAGIYLLLNFGKDSAAGWGIPMATDIAFSLGILTLIPQVNLGLKVFLTAFAIVDDLGAVLVIATFYTEDVQWLNLAAGGIVLALLFGMNIAGIQRPLAYILPGTALWYLFLHSGVHATVAGVLLAVTIPEARRIDEQRFLKRARLLLRRFEQATHGRSEKNADQCRQDVILSLEEVCEDLMTPLRRLEHELHPWISVLIMPLFALANAGVTINGQLWRTVTSDVGLGIILGLVVGKQAGVTGFAWLAARTNIADVPRGVRWAQIYGVGWLGGIGFTMSLFIADLAFGNSPHLNAAKIGILGASLIAGATGTLIVWWVGRGTARLTHDKTDAA